MAKPKFIEDTLSEKYPSINQNEYLWKQLIEHQGVGIGWHELIIEMVQKIELIYKEHNNPIEEDMYINEIKEKYGGLRVDFRRSIMEVHELVSLYENKSETICEECGATGKIRSYLNWIQSLCDDCYKAEKEPEK